MTVQTWRKGRIQYGDMGEITVFHSKSVFLYVDIVTIFLLLYICIYEINVDGNHHFEEAVFFKHK